MLHNNRYKFIIQIFSDWLDGPSRQIGAKSLLIFLFIIYPLSLVKGQSYQEIENVRKQYQEALARQEMQKSQNIRDAEETAKSTALPDKLIYARKDVESLIANTEKLLERLKELEDSTKTMQYIGYDIFMMRDTIPFWQNLPTPIDYVIGPGDELIISLYGSAEAYYSEVVNRDGQIFLKTIGTLNLNGMTIKQAKVYIENRYSKIYLTFVFVNTSEK